MNKVTAILLAAGESKRMRQPKLLLSWGGTTVLGAVIRVLRSAGIDDILVITGGAREQVEELCAQAHVRAVYNDHYAAGGMLSSIQCGLSTLASCRAAPGEGALICLGDQPQVREETVDLAAAATVYVHFAPR